MGKLIALIAPIALIATSGCAPGAGGPAPLPSAPSPFLAFPDAKVVEGEADAGPELDIDADMVPDIGATAEDAEPRPDLADWPDTGSDIDAVADDDAEPDAVPPPVGLGDGVCNRADARYLPCVGLDEGDGCGTAGSGLCAAAVSCCDDPTSPADECLFCVGRPSD